MPTDEEENEIIREIANEKIKYDNFLEILKRKSTIITLSLVQLGVIFAYDFIDMTLREIMKKAVLFFLT